MKNLLNYSHYDYLLCVSVENAGGITIYGCSNRTLMLYHNWIIMEPEDVVDENLGLLLKDIFLVYFELHTKNACHLTAIEASTLSSIVQYFKNIKARLASEFKLLLDTSQIIFVVLSALADWDVCLLRALFVEAEWITPEDDESKLMLVPFIEAHVNNLQMFSKGRPDFRREGKYMILHMHLAEEEDQVVYTLTCFKMQCAKELMAVSRRLASSDFLLVPFVLSSKSVCLPTTDEAMLTTIKRTITNLRNNYKARNGIELDDEGSIYEVSELAIQLRDMLQNASLYMFSHRKTIGDYLHTINFEKYQLQDLQNYQIDDLYAEIRRNTSVQQHVKTVNNFVQECLDEYGTISNAPDGICNIIPFYTDRKFATSPHAYCIEESLLQEKLIKPEDVLTLLRHGAYYQYGALQRPFKILQIVNSLLPPLIQNEEGSDKVAFNDWKKDDGILLPLNSYYLQANISQRQIEFILNKVVKTASSKTHAEMFTVHERIVEINDVRIAAPDILWSHYQLLESRGLLDSLISFCQEHEGSALSFSHYECFTANMASVILRWFRSKRNLSDEELDAYQLIPISKYCACALKLSHRMLLETGLKPAISSIAGTIAGITLSNDHFGLYQVSALFIKEGMDFIDNMYYLHSLEHHLEEKLQSFFQNRQQRLAMFFIKETPEHTMRQYLVRGNYTQKSSSTYTISLQIETNKKYFTYGYMDDHVKAYRDLPGTSSEAESYMTGKYKFQSNCTILNRGEDLPNTGVTKTLCFPSCLRVDIDYSIVQKDGFEILVKHQYLQLNGNCSYTTISILPVHHSSTLKITASQISPSDGRYPPFEDVYSVGIRERLSLKKK